MTSLFKAGIANFSPIILRDHFQETQREKKITYITSVCEPSLGFLIVPSLIKAQLTHHSQNYDELLSNTAEHYCFLRVQKPVIKMVL